MYNTFDTDMDTRNDERKNSTLIIYSAGKHIEETPLPITERNMAVGGMIYSKGWLAY